MTANSSGYTTAAHADDRKTLSAYDALGRKVVTVDASGHNQYYSYDAHGNLAKQWQQVEGDGKTGTTYQVHVYDKLGRLAQTIVPNSRWAYVKAEGKIVSLGQEAVGVVKTTMKYNGFGEMTSKRLTSSGEEQFHYDRAGRLWRTNSGDGVWRVHLFDLQGNVTSEIRSPGDSVGSIDLSGADLTAAAADKLLGTRRIDSVYDALGRLAAREEASRREQQGGVIAVGQQVEAVVESATDVGIGSPYWLGKNRVVLSWNSLAALGSGDVKVTIEYQAATTPAHADSASINDNGFRSYTSGAMTSAVGASGATLEWSEHSNEWYGGISHVTRVLVQKKDVNGVWRTAIDQATGYGGSVIDLATPPNPDAGIKFEMRKSGTAGDAGWFAIGTYDFGARRRFDANGLAPGSYEYRVHVQTPGEDWHLTSNGTIELGSPLLNAISASMGFGKTGAGMFSWKAPAAGVGQDFRYRLAGGTGIWRSIDIETNAAGLQVVDTRVLDAGNYDFELLWSRTDHGVPVSHAIGTFTVGSSPAGSISSKPGTAAISTSEGGTLAQDKDLNGESRWLRPQVRHNVDRWGNVVTITDPRSSKWKTTYTYNANNQKVSETLPSASDGPGPATARYYFDELGRQVAVRDANGNVNRQTWDAGGQLIAETHADGGVVSHGYNAFGNKTWSRDAEGGFVTFKYDDLGRMTGLSKGVHTVYAIGSDNETVNEATREITEKWSYDALGQVISHTNGNGQKVTYSYDLLGNLVQTKQPLGQASRSAYDAFGRKVAEVDAAGASRTWTYGEFGALKAHKDLGGNEYAYSYDNAGQLTSRTTKDGAQVLGYVYDGAGQLTVMTDSDLKKTTTYGYDLAGRRVREKVVQGSTTFQDNHLSYDARGRLRDVADSRVHLVMEYDAVGNRTRIQSRVNYQGVEEEVTDKSDRFFLYDAMNRQTTVDGINAAGVIGTDQGHTISYDKNGNRTKDVFYGNRVTGEWVEPNDHHPEYGTPGASVYTYKVASARIAEVYTYDPLNRLTTVVRDGLKVDVRLYDGADRVVRSGPVDVDPERMAKVNEGSDPASSHSADIRLHRYDANGRLLNQRVRSSDGVTLKTDTSWDPSKGVAGYIPDGYDEAGNVLGYVVVDYQADTRVEYRNSFALYGNYQTLTTAAKSNKQGTGSTTHEYDANGFLVAVTDAIQSASNRKFVNDAEGRVLYAKQAGHIKRQLIANGEVLGTYGVGVDPLGTNGVSFADHADFNFGYERVSASYPSAAPSAYQVQSGDTLQGIAQSAYGDSSLWYRIADANGFSSSSELRAGQTISIPNRVGTISNNSTTFKPYDPTRMVGDTTPNLPPPAQGGGCGGVGQVLMLVVAVVVTIYTAGLLTPAVSGAATGFGATMAAGMGTLGAGTVASVATGVVAAGVGSVASQLVGLATGTIDKFSWKQVASAAIGGGIAAGLPASGAFAAGGTGVVARAVAGNALSQGVAVAVGLQDSFSWVRVAASAVGAGLGHAAGPAVANAAGGGAFGDFASSLTTGLVTGAAVHVMSGGRVSAHQVAVDAFGNALGQSLAASSSSVEQRPSYSLVEGQLTGGQGLKAPAGLWDDVGPSSTYGYESNAYVDYSIGSARLSGSTGVPTQGDTVLEAWRTNRGGEVESLGRWAVTPAQVMGAPAYVDPDTGTETRAVSVYAGRAQMRDLPPLPPAATQRSVDVLARAAQDAQESYRDAQHQAVAEGDAVGFVTAKFGGLAAEVGYDAARAGRGLYRLFTDGEARAQAVGQLKYLAANPKVIVDGAVQAAADFARKPFDEQADSVFKGGLGLFAGAGVGKVGLTAGELTLQGAGRTAQWLAPTAERVIFNQMDRIGLVVRVVPDAPRMNAGPVMAGEAGRFGGLHARRVTGDGLTPHHMPQAGAGRTAYEDGGALVMTHAEHLQTRTWGSKGIGTLRSDAGLSFREVLYNDIRDVRSIVGTKYNAGLRDLADYYRRYYPDLMQK
ncbi:MAG TPA: LysM peptidoglycan-binding domain-containing protein [Ramlibacter sp.]